MNNSIRRTLSSIFILVFIPLALPACGTAPAGSATGETRPAQIETGQNVSTAVPSAGRATAAPEPSATDPYETEAYAPEPAILNETGATLAERFNPPAGYKRVPAEAGSFTEYLRKLPLQPHGSLVHYYDGTEKPDDDYIAVVDMDVGKSDLQQCADTVLRLYSEYLYGRRDYDRISFHFVSGFEFSWDKWRRGYRVDVQGNDVSWVKSAGADSGVKAFNSYLQKLYTYASTRSMAHSDLISISPSELAVGDMFIKGGSPGHVVLVADMAADPSTGRKCFILLQGYMPAQDAQILRNLDEPDISPWVMLPEDPTGEFITPEYVFTWDQAMRFKR